MRQDWRVKKKCDNCPFHESGPGRELRESLRPGRFEGIVADLMRGGHFFCHKTTSDEEQWDEDGNYFGGGKLCAGAIALQREAGIVSDYEQIRSRLDAMRTGKRSKL